MTLPGSELDQQPRPSADALAGDVRHLDLATHHEQPRALVHLVLGEAFARRQVERDRTRRVARGEDLGQARLELERLEVPAVHSSAV
jgi:hypothetical protein